MKDIFWGVLIIVLGLTIGDSVFISKNPSVLGYIFDVLGLFWIGKGIYSLVKGSPTDEQTEASQEPPD